MLHLRDEWRGGVCGNDASSGWGEDGMKTNVPLFKISDIVGRKITKVVFENPPEMSDDIAPLFENLGMEPTETTYSSDTTDIKVHLDNGLILSFWNSEWGGMTVTKERPE